MEWLGPALTQLGVSGVVGLIAVLAIRYLITKNDKLQDEKDDLQEKRIEEMRTNLAATVANTAAITGNTKVIEGNNTRVDTLIQSNQRIENLLQQILMKVGA